MRVTLSNFYFIFNLSISRNQSADSWKWQKTKESSEAEMGHKLPVHDDFFCDMHFLSHDYLVKMKVHTPQNTLERVVTFHCTFQPACIAICLGCLLS